MSKYNLIDIYEQYQIGSGWTQDFDYDGMLKTGLGTSIDTPIEVLKQIFEDFTDVNYHREAEHLSYAIDAIEIGDMMEAQDKISDFHAEIKKTQGDQGMDIEPTVGKFMASKMEEGKDKDKEPRDGVKSAAAKLGIKPNHVKEADIEENHQSLDREVADRIEGMLNIPLKKKFLDAGMDLIQDVLEEDPFYIDDIVSHLANELNAYYDSFGRRGDQLAGLGEAESFFKDDPVKIKVEKAVDNADRALKSVNSMKQVAIYMDSLRNDLRLNPNGAKDYLEYGKEDWIEDFENYIGDKALQEHFKRFI